MPSYNYELVFWLGQPISVYQAVVPIPLFLLTVDRYLALNPLLTNGKTLRRLAFRFSCVCIAVAVVATILVNGVGELPLNMTAIAGCQSFSCTLLRFRNLPTLVFKNSVEVVNLVLAYFFLRAWRRAVSKQHGVVRSAESALRDHLVRSVIIAEIVISVLPSLFGFIFGIV